MISALIKLLKSGKFLTIQQISEKLDTSCDVVLSMLEILEKKGIVEKVDNCKISSACTSCKMKCGCNQHNVNESFTSRTFRIIDTLK